MNNTVEVSKVQNDAQYNIRIAYNEGWSKGVWMDHFTPGVGFKYGRTVVSSSTVKTALEQAELLFFAL